MVNLRLIPAGTVSGVRNQPIVGGASRHNQR